MNSEKQNKFSRRQFLHYTSLAAGAVALAACVAPGAAPTTGGRRGRSQWRNQDLGSLVAHDRHCRGVDQADYRQLQSGFMLLCLAPSTLFRHPHSLQLDEVLR